MRLARGDAMTFLKKRLLWGNGGLTSFIDYLFVCVARDSWLSFDELLQQASSDYQASFDPYLLMPN